MSLFGNLEFNSLDDLLRHQIEDLYDSEHQLLERFPKLVDTAVSPDLKQALDKHLQQTRDHAARLETIFRGLGWKAERGTCEAMKGLLAEVEEMTGAEGNPEIRDAALIAAAQKIEHYEIAGYGTARSLAMRLGRGEAAKRLESTLEEETSADRTLTQVAQAEVNAAAQR